MSDTSPDEDRPGIEFEEAESTIPETGEDSPGVGPGEGDPLPVQHSEPEPEPERETEQGQTTDDRPVWNVVTHGKPTAKQREIYQIAGE